MDPMISTALIGGGLGMLNSQYNDQRQIDQQRKLNELQIQSQEQLGRFNQGLAMETWENTNYSAQRKQMEKAGLNVGLMYSKGGPGGTTSGGQAGNVAGGQAPQGGGEIGMGIQQALAAKLMKTEIDNTEADTKLKQTEATKKAGAETENIQQSTANAKIQAELMNIDKQIKERTTDDIVATINAGLDKIRAEVKIQQTQGNIAAETADQQIQQATQQITINGLTIAAQKIGLVQSNINIEETKAKINKIIKEMERMGVQNAQGFQQLNQQQQQILLQTIQTEFNTSDAARVKQWTSIVTDAIGAIGASKLNQKLPKSKIEFDSEKGTKETIYEYK